MSNESLDQIIEQVTVESENGAPVITDIEALKLMLMSRDDTILDNLRMAALAQGLRPSITQLVLAKTGLGEPLDPETQELIQTQAQREVAELVAQQAYVTELIRRSQEGG